jgi:putative transposase
MPARGPRLPDSPGSRNRALLRRQITDPVRYEPADRFWYAALSSLLPRRHDIFPVQPATILTCHHRFIAWKSNYSARRRPSTPFSLPLGSTRERTGQTGWHRRSYSNHASLRSKNAAAAADPTSMAVVVAGAQIVPSGRR